MLYIFLLLLSVDFSPQTQASIVRDGDGSLFLQMAIRDGHGISGEIIQSASVGQPITLDVIMHDTGMLEGHLNNLYIQTPVKMILMYSYMDYDRSYKCSKSHFTTIDKMCNSDAIYDFYAHDCYAHDDGTNTPEASINIIDANGCAVRVSRAVDVPVFTTSAVSGGAKHVYVHMYGFQFTTSESVYFECQVRPCLQVCNRQQCEAPLRSKRNSIENGNLKSLSKRQTIDGSLKDNYKLHAVLQIRPQSLNSVIPSARDDPPVIKEEGATQVDLKTCRTVYIAQTICEAVTPLPLTTLPPTIAAPLPTTASTLKACTVDFSQTSGSFFTQSEPVTDGADILMPQVAHGVKIALFCGYDKVVQQAPSVNPWLDGRSTAATCQDGTFVWEVDGDQTPPVCHPGATGEGDAYTNCPDYAVHCLKGFVRNSCKTTCMKRNRKIND